jgi:N-methylhydantoinase B
MHAVASVQPSSNPNSATLRVDPIRFEVIRNGFLEATEEMALALRRSAYSTNIKTRCDFSCCFFDGDLRPIAQSFSQPNHLGSMVGTVQQAVREYGIERLGHGDHLVVNYPYPGGAHLNDIVVIAPFHYRGEICGYFANLAHHVDVGGGAPASVGAFREVYQEGVIIPPVRLVQDGKIVDDIFRLLIAQIRSKRETAGDFRAQIAANNTGGRRLTALFDRYGAQEVGFYMDELISYTERRTRAELAKLPQGEYRAEGYVDNDGFGGEPVRLVVRVVIDDEGVLFDFTGSDRQRRAPVNSTFAQTYSAAAFSLKCITDPDLPVNEGFYRHVRLVAPEGTVVNCTHPSPVVAGWETQVRLNDVIFKALAQGLPEKMIAGTKAMQCHAGFGGLDPRTNEYYCYLETLGGGYGARARSDGPDAVQTHGQSTENAPVEEMEINYPVRVLRYELVENSEGAGRHRGGLGVRRDYRFDDHEVTFTILADRDRRGPWGLFGGQEGRKAYYILNPDGESKELSSKTTVDLKPADIISYQTCGGGGYGPPEERDPALVLRDVRDAKISLERARSVYKVAIDPETWTVDQTETARLRANN